jgi:hypothetical protein
MNKMIDLIFEELKHVGAVRSGVDFSKEWLGMEGSYWRGLRAKHREPSLKAIARCAVKLKGVADSLSVCENPKMEAAQARLRHLADGCVGQILRDGI